MTEQQQSQILDILKPLAERLYATEIPKAFKLIYLNQNGKLELIDLLFVNDKPYRTYGCIFTEPTFILGIINDGYFQDEPYYDQYLTDKEKYFLHRGFLTTINDFIHLDDYRPTGSTFLVSL